MKILLILITTIVFSLPSFAKGEIDYVKSANNVTLIGSNTNIGSIISAGAMKRGMIIAIANSKKAPLIYSLEQYTSNNKQQYALKVWVSPNKKMNIAIAFLLGLMVSLGLVFLLEYLDNTYKNKEQLEKELDIPVIGVIPDVDIL